ncbi:type II toxin-antitoxin system VapC family toxin [Thermococcus thioreducens]|uniref:Predicted nucleic acid-binding protein, contains PIN domain n=1 Tax=Thermococcus thioreducens TaxID=277988 RepID=A0A0Q2M347_9EURY|nr:type II toxin-antitoxin system VapC family toxin [Thermococcus thioreducens]ASJ12526.1 twitching motility protein PilT [Thermococcus thioreducens]KQH82473.1 twitching motility protein PilT [Thermococcus thioreducens]SEV89359.1 Predicted nucleic acid-binding protein, contains PIN domain [Thermococcus thioreducens]
MTGKNVYLDSSAILKRYISEKDSEVVRDLFRDAYRGEIKLAFSFWNIGEVLEVFDKKLRRGELSKKNFNFLKKGFLAEIKRFTRLGVLEVVPVHSLILADTWKLIEKYHLYQADALQIASAKYAGAERFYTADKRLYNASIDEGLSAVLLGGD